MFLEAWNYLRGYVTIEVSGFSVERFINMAAYRGIYIWDVMPNGGKISMKMSVKGFKRLKGCTKKTRCKMRIVNKTGLPFLFFKYRKRKIFAFGVLFFIAALYLLSSFIWIVEISGNERIETNAILAYCEETGLKPGAFKHTMNTKKITNGFMADFDNIAWLAIEIKGTIAKINIVETIDAPEIIDKTTPCDIVAASDGLVTDVVVISGTPLVTPRDIVKAGDILVSGMLKIMDGEEVKGYHYTHAQAEIYAKVWHEINLTEDLLFIRKDYTGKVKKLFSLNILKTKFNVINTGISYKNYDKITKIKQLNLGGDFALPLSLSVTECKEYKPVLIERTVDDANALLLEKLDKMLENILSDGNVVILDRNHEFGQKDGKAFLNAVITVQKRIDEQVKVSPSDIEERSFVPEPVSDNYSFDYAEGF